MTTISLAHLNNVKAWEVLAAGVVDGVYPMPIKAQSLIDLVKAEISTKATHVTICLANTFLANHKGEATYQAASIPGMSEQDFRVSTSEQKLNVLEGYEFVAFKQYSFREEIKVKASTIADLVVRMAAEGVKGTVSITFLSFPNGSGCNPDVHEEIKLVI